MTVKELKEEIIVMVSDMAQTDRVVTLETHLIRELGLTSVEVMMLVSDLEDRFSVDISSKMLRDVWTVGDLCNVIIAALR